MFWKSLIRRFALGPSPARMVTGPGQHLSFRDDPAAVYAIGDVHGRLDLLLDLEAQICADAVKFVGEIWIVVLGDSIDRGPNSAQVIDHLMAAPPAGLRRYCIRGNHESMMLDFFDRPRTGLTWLEFGGIETLLSYGVPPAKLGATRGARALQQLAFGYVPDEHVAFMRAMPVLLETPSALYVHAGLRPGVPLAAQTEADLIWIRDDFAADYSEFGKIVVHGHTPREEPLITPHRIAIDTGACLTGRLTAVRLVPGAPPLVMTATRNSN